MKPTEIDSQPRAGSGSGRVAVIALACVVLYAGFIEYMWGWAYIFDGWKALGAGTVALALSLFCATYFVRCYRIYRYFPQQTSGHFLKLFRLTQVHNLLNIMLPFRIGETSFPILMRSEFGIPLGQATAALLVMRLLDLHALFAAAGVGLVIGMSAKAIGWALWALFCLLPVGFFLLRGPAMRLLGRFFPARLHKLLDDIDRGIPTDRAALASAWFQTIVNWGVKVVVFVWVLVEMGVTPLSAGFGGALGGELSSVLPFHAPGGAGTYAAGIVAGAVSFGAATTPDMMNTLARASINAHLILIISSLVGTALSLILSRPART